VSNGHKPKLTYGPTVSPALLGKSKITARTRAPEYMSQNTINPFKNCAWVGGIYMSQAES